MTNLHDAQIRSALISERIRQRTDLALRELIAQYQESLTFHPLDDLMISEQAWRHVEASGIEPKLVFDLHFEYTESADCGQDSREPAKFLVIVDKDKRAAPP